MFHVSQGALSGEREIRTPGTACAVRRFSKPVTGFPKAHSAKEVTTNASPDMSSGMSETDRIPPDLLPLVNAWTDLPEHLRAAILTLVNAAENGR